MDAQLLSHEILLRIVAYFSFVEYALYFFEQQKRGVGVRAASGGDLAIDGHQRLHFGDLPRFGERLRVCAVVSVDDIKLTPRNSSVVRGKGTYGSCSSSASTRTFPHDSIGS